MARFMCIAALVLAYATTPVAAQSVTIAVAGPTVTLTPTAAQVAALQAVVDAVNANERASLPPWTVNEWLSFILIGRVQSAVEALKVKDATTACAAFEKLTPTQQNTIKTTLGGKSPCR